METCGRHPWWRANLRAAEIISFSAPHHSSPTTKKFDGSGYPDGLRGEDIPIAARVLQVVDVYDALTTVRPYKACFLDHGCLANHEARSCKGHGGIRGSLTSSNSWSEVARRIFWREAQPPAQPRVRNSFSGIGCL